MSEALVVSQILLWGCVIALGLLCLALARQIGVLHERIAPAGALSINQHLKVGSKAPVLTLPDIDGQNISVGESSDSGRSSLLFFISPDCPICKKLLPIVRSAKMAERNWIDVLLASDGGEVIEHRGLQKSFGFEDTPYLLSEGLGKAYGVSKLPYAVLIDENGNIASMGMVNSREHIESLFEAKERRVASLQDFVRQRDALNKGS